jgi:TRAP-type C4-dicarboxylate transport system permease small subunit
MHTLLYYLVVLLLGAVLVMCLRTGYVGWEWWDRRGTYRDQYPGAYWAMIILQVVLFVYFVMHGKQMPLY